MVDQFAAAMTGAVDAIKGIRLTISGREYREPVLIDLEQPFAVVGRSKRADISLASSKVSYRHAYLQVLDGRIVCIDLGSDSGVQIRGKRCAEEWVDPGDSLKIGPYTLNILGTPAGPVENGAPVAAAQARSGDVPTLSRYDLEFFDESLPEPIHSIDRRVTLVGRSTKCAVQLADSSVSRVHCALVLTHPGLWIVDLLGKDGTRLDEKPVRCGLIENGSELAIGTYLMSVWHRGSDRRLVESQTFKPAPTAEAKRPTKEASPAPDAGPAPAVSNAPAASPARDGAAWLGTLFSIEFIGSTMVIVPTISGGMFRYSKLQTEANALRRKLDELDVRGLVIDLHALDYVGSEVIGAVVALARKAEDVGGQTVLCRAAPRLKDALTTMGLHRLWPLYSTREAALDAIK